MLHSSFRDAYKGRIILIRFDNEQKGFSATLKIDDEPTALPEPNRVWEDRDDAIVDVSNAAREIIDGM
jgi:hypothetical protein